MAFLSEFSHWSDKLGRLARDQKIQTPRDHLDELDESHLVASYVGGADLRYSVHVVDGRQRIHGTVDANEEKIGSEIDPRPVALPAMFGLSVCRK